jgi:hypothetical protein
MRFKNIFLIVGLIIFIILIPLFLMFDYSSYYNAYNKSIDDKNISECESLSSFRYIIKSLETDKGNKKYSIKNQKDSCIEEVSIYFEVDKENLENFFNAILNNNPKECPKLYLFNCLNEIKEKYRDPSICQNYFINKGLEEEYYNYEQVFECQGYFIALKKQDENYCEQFNSELKNYCYFVIVREYNYMKSTKPELFILNNETEKDFIKKPNIPYICDNIKASTLKDSCEYVFKEFNSI